MQSPSAVYDYFTAIFAIFAYNFALQETGHAPAQLIRYIPVHPGGETPFRFAAGLPPEALENLVRQQQAARVLGFRARAFIRSTPLRSSGCSRAAMPRSVGKGLADRDGVWLCVYWCSIERASVREFMVVRAMRWL